MDWLFNVLSSLANSVQRFVLAAIDFLFQVADFLVKAVFILADALVQVWKILGRALRDTAGFFKRFWTNYVHGFFSKLLHRIRRLKETLDAWTRPVRDYLRRVRNFWDHLFTRTLRPWLDAMQRLRRVLLVGRLFGIKAATRLDNRLFRLETRIAGIFLDIRRKMNEVSNFLNLVLDPLGLLHINQHLGAVIRSIGELDALLVNAGNRPLFARELERIKQDKASETLSGQRLEIDRAIKRTPTDYEKELDRQWGHA